LLGAPTERPDGSSRFYYSIPSTVSSSGLI
jgi:hypothetical protein